MIGTDKFFQQLKEQLSKFSESNALTVSILADLIKNNLIEDLYNNIPDEIKSIYDTRNFTSSYSATKKILSSIGIPENILDTLSATDLYKLIQSMSLFINNQSSYEFFNKILNMFEEEIYIAELFLAYDKNNDKVYLTPKWINNPPPDIEKTYKVIDYAIAYEKIPELLITEDEWLNQIHKNNIVLPIRTNILLVVSNITYNISYLNNVISAILFNYLKTSSLFLYLQGSVFSIQFEDIIKLYYYIIALYNNLEYLTYNQPVNVTITISSNNTTLSSIDEIDQIVSKYDNVKNKSTFQELVNYITANFRPINISQPVKYTFSDLESELYAKYPDLIKYLNSLYNNSNDKKITLYQLLLDIKKSLYQSYPNVRYMTIFINTYLSNTFQPTNPGEDLNTLKIIQFYKPVDVLILDVFLKETILQIKDKFNSLYTDDKFKILCNLESIVSIYNLLDNIANIINTRLNYRYSYFDISYINVQEISSEQFELDDFMTSYIISIITSILDINDKNVINVNYTYGVRYIIGDNFNIIVE